MAKEKYTKLKTTTLVSVIIHGANEFGLHLARTLTEQGSRVIIIDQYNKDSKPFVTRLKKLQDSDFVAFEGMEELFKVLSRFDYMFYLQNELLNQSKDFGSKGFLDESNHLEKCLKAARKYNVKTALITTIHHNKQLIEEQLLSTSVKHSAYSPAELQKYSETLIAEYHDKSKLNARIIRLGTLLGARYPAIGDEKLQQILLDSVKNDHITINGEGLDNHYIINAKDAVYGILKLTFSDATIGDVVSLSNKKPLTTLSIAYKLLELNTEASNIKFENAEEDRALLQNQYSPAPNAEDYGWKASSTLEDTFIETISGVYENSNMSWDNKPTAELVSNKGTQKQVGNSQKTKIKTVRTPFGRFIDKLISPFMRAKSKLTGGSQKRGGIINWKNLGYFTIAVIGLSVVSYFFITPIASIGINSTLIYYQKDDIYEDIASFNLSDASKELETASGRVDKIAVATERLEWAFQIAGQDELYINVSQVIFAASYAVDGAQGMAVALEPLALYAKEFQPAISFGSSLPSSTREYSQYLEALRANRGQLEKAGDDITLASRIIDTTEISVFPSFMQDELLELKEKNTEIQDVIEPLNNTVAFLPELLGVDGRQRYLVLLQNPSEIRSTGGWLSSYAIVGIENGQIRQLDVDDIYNADGLLVTQEKFFNAPKSMQDALDVKTWSFSTSNWSADFPQVANDAEFFVNESGKAVNIDGVIAIDVTMIQSLLEKWGGLDVPGETEIITSENLYSKIFEIHTEFIPGSRQKATFIANLSNATLQKLLSSDGEGWQELGEVLLKGLDEKHVLVYLENSNANGYIDVAGWSGRLKDEYKSSPVSVEWNWGANKANLFLTRNSTVDIEILDEDQIKYTLTTSIENSSETDVYPEGNYINWHRVYVPENAQIVNTTGFENSQTDVYLEDGFKVVGGWFNVPLNSTNRLEVSYTVNRESGHYFPIEIYENTISFNLLMFKQPGMNNDKQSLTIAYPESWAVTNSADMNRSINQLNSQFELITDKENQLTWEYK